MNCCRRLRLFEGSQAPKSTRQPNLFRRLNELSYLKIRVRENETHSPLEIPLQDPDRGMNDALIKAHSDRIG